MSNFRFSLEKYSGFKSRFHCPNCNKREFTRYIDNAIWNYIDDSVGRCNRIEKCGYHKTPKMFYEESGEKPRLISELSLPEIAIKPTFFCDEELLLQSLHLENRTSYLFDFLIQYFDKEKVQNVFQKYLIGVSNFWGKSTIFWQIDRMKKIRCGKIMNHDSHSGRRDQSKFKWIRNADVVTQMRQVFFGVHLIDYYNS